MNVIKTTIAVASVAACCMGNQMPAKAFIFGDIPEKSALADMTANLACDVKAGKITSQAAAVAGIQAARRVGFNTALLQDPDVLRWAAERMHKFC